MCLKDVSLKSERFQLHILRRFRMVKEKHEGGEAAPLPGKIGLTQPIFWKLCKGSHKVVQQNILSESVQNIG